MSSELLLVLLSVFFAATPFNLPDKSLTFSMGSEQLRKTYLIAAKIVVGSL